MATTKQTSYYIYDMKFRLPSFVCWKLLGLHSIALNDEMLNSYVKILMDYVYSSF